MSACPYTGTSIIHKIPWSGQAGADSDLSRAEHDDESDEDHDKSGFRRLMETGLNKIKWMFRK